MACHPIEWPAWRWVGTRKCGRTTTEDVVTELRGIDLGKHTSRTFTALRPPPATVTYETLYGDFWRRKHR